MVNFDGIRTNKIVESIPDKKNALWNDMAMLITFLRISIKSI